MQLILTDFGDIYGFAAAMNIVFVAADYFQSYAYILSSKIFKFQAKVEEEIDRLKKVVIDRTTIESIEPVIVDGESSSTLIEKVKDSHSNLLKKIETEGFKLENEVNLLCESKTNSFISLYLSLYSVTALLLIGVYDKWPIVIQNLWIVLTVLSTFWVIKAWISSEPDKCHVRLCSLKHCLYLFFGIFLLSIAFSLIISHFYDIPNLVTDSLYIYSEIFSISNFIVYIFIISRKSRKIRIKINDVIAPMEKECKEINKEASSLINLNTISSGLKKKR